jgi:hypothetical protein
MCEQDEVPPTKAPCGGSCNHNSLHRKSDRQHATAHFIRAVGSPCACNSALCPRGRGRFPSVVTTRATFVTVAVSPLPLVPTSSESVAKFGPTDPTHQAHFADINALAVPPSGKWLASASSDATVKIWMPPPKRPTATTPATAPVSFTATSDQGMRGVVGHGAASAHEVNTFTGKLLPFPAPF